MTRIATQAAREGKGLGYVAWRTGIPTKTLRKYLRRRGAGIEADVLVANDYAD